MDPVILILHALVSGALARAQDRFPKGDDSYDTLKAQVTMRLGGGREVGEILAELEASVQTPPWERLRQAVARSGAAADMSVIRLAQAYLAVHDPEGTRTGAYTVATEDFRSARTRDVPESTEPKITPRGRSQSRQRPPQPRSAVRVTPQPERNPVRRVIVIEDCSGVQVGRDNDQHSVYQVKLPTAAFKSPDELAERLLGENTPWASDRWSHDAPDIRFREPGRRPRDESRAITSGPDGDTMVVVRNSEGVQIGDCNVQRNRFRIRVAGVPDVRADRLGMTSDRQRLVSQLREDPYNRSAARELANNVTGDAQIDLIARMERQVREAVADPRIKGRPRVVRDRTGIQVGYRNQAKVTVRVEVAKWDPSALERQIRNAARRIPTAPGRASRYGQGRNQDPPQGPRSRIPTGRTFDEPECPAPGRDESPHLGWNPGGDARSRRGSGRPGRSM